MSRRLHQQRGYTIVEVLSAMTLFAIGAAGVISMQRVTIQGGDDARRMDVATNIAHEWAFRLQRDAAFWTQPNTIIDDQTNLGDTAWLKNAPATTGQTAWLDPTQSDGIPGRSGAFDLFGRDRANGSGDHMYCAQYRLEWIVQPGTSKPFNNGALLRAEVRVFWSRLDNAPVQNCGARPLDPDDATAPTFYHFVYTSTAIRMNPNQ